METAAPTQTGLKAGPRGMPLIGLLPRMRKDPLGLFREVSRDFGEVIPLDFGFRGQAYLANHPDFVKPVLQDNRANYRKSDLYEKMRPVFGKGLLMSENEHWAKHRRMIQPAFSHGRLDGVARLMAEEAAAAAARLEKGRTVDMAAEMSALTLTIVVKAMFGSEIQQGFAAIGEAVEVLNEHANHRFFAPVDTPLWVPTPRNLRARRALAHVENLVYGMIRKRRSSPGALTGPAGHDDLLAMLMEARYEDGSAMSETQVRDEVMTIFMAGHETTATALAWTLHALAANPEAEARLRRDLAATLGDGIPAFADLPRLPYLRMVVEESMRLYPPVWSFSRTALAADTLGGRRIPAGSLVMMSPYSMHRQPRLWDEPEAFRPERFAPAEVEKRPRYAYFPFGGGPRMCIGNNFALMEAQIILACLLRGLRFRSDPARPPVPWPLVTLRPKGGMWMTPEPAGSPSGTDGSGSRGGF